MRSRFVLAAGVIATVAFVAAGCGGGGGAAAGAAGGAAAVAPADSVMFVALDSDLGSSQWQAVDGLFQKLPAHDALLTQLRTSLEQKSGVSWANDVKPALGAELDVAVVPVDGKPQSVVLTQPADPAKLQALVAKLRSASASSTSDIVSAPVGDWTAIAESPAALDAVSGATSHLADDTVYQEAAAKLSGDALATAYANGSEARSLVTSLGGTVDTGEQLTWASADVVASGDGLRVKGYVRSEGGTPSQAYDAALLHQIPSGQLAVADFQAGPEGTVPATAKPLVAALGKVGAALGGETAVYVSPGAPLPAVTLVTQPSDPQAVLDGLHAALAQAGSTLGGAKQGGLDLGSILSGLVLSHAMVGSNLVVSTSQQQVDAFKGSGQKLADDGSFQEAQSASGMPAQTSGFVYVNLKDALASAQALASLAGAKVPGGDLSALRTLTAYGSGSTGGISSFTVFLEVK